MMILVTDHEVIENRTYIEMECGKKSAYISHSSLYINVICKNASHRTFKGAGRMFGTWEEAKAAYKSGDMKAMIEHAESLCV